MQVVKIVHGAFWGLLISVLSLQVYDRFTGNGKAMSFYMDEIDMTCVVGKDEGQKFMYCLNGDHRLGGDL